MTTTIAGGKISARIALTGQAQSALTFNDPVKIVGDYLFDKCDATHACIGYVTVPNVARGTGSLAGTYPQAQTPGDVSVDARAHAVAVVVAGTGGISAGGAVKIDSGGNYVSGSGPSDASFVGWALTTATAGNSFDLLVV
jgi:hypothetical protein